MINNIRLISFYLILFIILCLIHLSLYIYAFDDAYIHFRIAGNLLEHGKPYFNIDERLMASSSSGWTLLLYLFLGVIGKGLSGIAILNAALTTICAFVYSRVGEEISGNPKISNDILVSLAAVPVLLDSSIGLMETPAALLILGIGMLLYLRGRGPAFAFLSASVFFRPELAVFLLFLLIHNAVSGKIRVGRTIIYSASAAVPFIFYDLWFFGTLIPHAVIAKPLIYSVKPLEVIGLMFHPVLKGMYLRTSLFLLLLALNIVLIVRAGRSAPGSVERKASLLSVPATVIMAAYVFKRTYVFEWYVPIFLLPVFAGMFVYAVKRSAVIFTVALTAAFLPFLFSFSNTAVASFHNATLYPEFYQGARTRKYIEVATRLNDAYPGYTLMCSEAGGLGYGFKGRVFDGTGLLSGEALKYHPMKVPQERPNGLTGAIPPGYVKEVKPDIIVSYDCFCGAFMKSAEAANYVAVKEPIFTPSDLAITGVRNLWDSDNINIFVRKEKYSRKF